MMRIILVEDDPNFRLELTKMYQEIFRSIAEVEIDPISNGIEAIEKLKKNKYDLLSLDINLYSNHPREEDGKLKLDLTGANGLDVLKFAGQKKLCFGVVIITLVENDPELYQAIPDETQRLRLQMKLNKELNEYFPGHNLRLSKRPNIPISQQITFFREALTPEEIRRLCEVQYSVKRQLSSHTDKYTVKIISINTGEGKFIEHLEDKILLYRMAQLARKEDRRVKDREYILESEVCEIYNAQNNYNNNAKQFIDSCKRRLREIGIDDERLITRLRNSGWKLSETTDIPQTEVIH